MFWAVGPPDKNGHLLRAKRPSHEAEKGTGFPSHERRFKGDGGDVGVCTGPELLLRKPDSPVRLIAWL